jgi:tetratricopeptide (TPR) repeat protein/TolB-like protein
MVSLKFLSEELELSRDEERKQTFIQEVRAAAGIEHPHIAAIHEIDEAEGRTFIIMEYVPGKDLRQILDAGGLDLRRALELGHQIADGLAAAHESGVVHRGIKPENVIIAEDGYAKVIDFGLAKLLEPSAHSADASAEVGTKLNTKEGKVLGTVAYMSPEQARGESVDARTDIFSFGIVLYEMLTGQSPFRKENVAESLSAVVNQTPTDIEKSSGRLPPGLQRVMRKALAKDPTDRYQNMKDLAIDLRELREEMGSTTGAVAAVVAARSPLFWPAIGGIVLVGIGLGWLLFRDKTPPGLSETGRPAVAVLTFESHGDEQDEEIRWLSRGLPNMLLTDLAQTPGLDVVSSQRIQEILTELGQANVEAIDRSLVADVARRAGAGAVVLGSIFKLGDEIRIDVQVEDVNTGRVLSAESVRGQDVFPLVDELTGRIRNSLDLRDETADRPIADVTTASLEAFQLYTEGAEASDNLRLTDARRLLEQAVAIDPSFAMAYFELAEAMRTLGQAGLSDEYLEKALENQERLPDRQRLLLQAVHALRVEGDPDRATGILETLISLYPDEEAAHDQLGRTYRDQGKEAQALAAAERAVQALPRSGLLRNSYGYRLIFAGRYPEAIEQFQEYARLNPNEANPHDSLGEVYLISGEPEKAVEEYNRTLELDPSFFLTHQSRAWAFGMLGRFDEALLDLAAVRESLARDDVPPINAILLEAFTLSRAGRYEDAEQKLHEGLALAKEMDEVQTQAHMELLSAILAFERGGYAEVVEIIQRVETILSEYAGDARGYLTFSAQLLAGGAQARLGQLEAASARLDSLQKQYDSRNAWENWCYHTLAGEIALARNDLAAAETAFWAREPERKMYFNNGTIERSLFYNGLPFRDGLGRVQKAQGDLVAAIDTYRSVNQPGPDAKWTTMLEPRFVLAVARLLDGTGDAQGARAEYEHFLELWKNADEDLPELQEAKAYLAQ